MKYGHFIDKKQLFTGTSTSLINPATGQTYGDIYHADETTIELAVESAAAAQRSWQKYSPAEKSRVLHKLAALVRENNDRLAELDVLQAGKPWQEASGYDIESGAEAIEFFANAAALLRGDSYNLGHCHAIVQPQPYGVTLGIGAWNYPFQIAAWKLAPSIAAGNAMIFKPSELTPGSAVILAELCLEAGLPPGLFQVVQGDGIVASHLINHSLVRKVSLTGSVPTGMKVAETAAKSLTPTTLELGGKGPLLIFNDADLDSAVAASMLANFYTQGEICSNGTRVFVERNRLDQFIDILLDHVKNIQIGDPANPETQMGPLISKTHYDKVLGYIQKGTDQGAQLIYGGAFPRSLEQTAYAKGYFMEPAIFSDCSDDMAIVRDEIFGPVMSILSFDSEEEVISRANDTEFGLAGAVFTENMNRAMRVSHSLDVGVCWINNYNVTPVELPFGGIKNSGYGRENSIEAMYAYTESKTIFMEPGKIDFPY